MGGYYSSTDFNNLYSKVGDIGMKLIILDEFAYSKEKKSYISRKLHMIKTINIYKNILPRNPPLIKPTIEYKIGKSFFLE